MRLAARAFGVLGTGVEGFDHSGDAAAGTEVAYYFGPDGVGGFDYVVEDLVDDVFLKDAEVAVGEEIFLERFELEAQFARHVADGEATEVGQTGLGADAGELGVVDEDLVSLELVPPGFDGGELDVEAGFCVVVGVAGGFGGHASILAIIVHAEGPGIGKGPRTEDSRPLCVVAALSLGGGSGCSSVQNG